MNKAKIGENKTILCKFNKDIQAICVIIANKIQQIKR